YHDERGIVWPEAIAPYKVYIVRLGSNSKVMQFADKLHDDLTAQNVAVLYDDRDARAGEKFADADLIGIPYRIVVSEKSIETGQLELKARTSQEVSMVSPESVTNMLVSKSGSLV